MRRALLPALGLVVACAGDRRHPPPPPAPAPPPTPAVVSPVARPARAGSGAPVQAEAVEPTPPQVSVAPPRLTAIRKFQKIRILPRWDAELLGLLRAGQSVALKQAEPVTGEAVGPCVGGWYAIEPRGYVCQLPDASTLADDDLRARAAQEVLPDTGDAYPFHYGRAHTAPRYDRIPTAAEQRQREWRLDEHLARHTAKHGPIEPAPPPSPTLDAYFRTAPLQERSTTYHGMKIAWSHAFSAEGRTWLVTPDLRLIPRDKVEPEPRVAAFSTGLDASDAPAFPFAMITRQTPRLDRQPAGGFVEGNTWPQRALLPLTGRRARLSPHHPLLEIQDGVFVRDHAASVFRQEAKPRWGVGDSGKWINVRINEGALVAYEGDRPVFAAAVSPGVDGASVDGKFRTPVGRYRVYAKWLTHDMGGSTEQGNWLVREVPWVAYFQDGYALHGAWWHDGFGHPRSHGCINLAPDDAKRLFAWMDPQVPEDWYAVRTSPTVEGTMVVINP